MGSAKYSVEAQKNGVEALVATTPVWKVGKPLLHGLHDLFDLVLVRVEEIDVRLGDRGV